MFYPGDPTEERKRQLLDALMGGSRGGGGAAGGGRKIGRMPGSLGRGMRFGGPGGGGGGMARFGIGPPGLGGLLPPGLQDGLPSQAQGNPGGPNKFFGGQFMNPGGPQTMVQNPMLQSLIKGLQGYGAPRGKWGME